MKIGLVTNKLYAELPPDDQLLQFHLNSNGHTVDALVWDSNDVNWREWDVIIIRSVWDYHLQPEKFLEWLHCLDKAGAKTFNTPALVKKNMHKSYLLDFKEAGFKVIPTHLFRKGEKSDFHAAIENLSEDEIILKPAISLSAYNTWRFHRTNVREYENTFQEMINKGDVILQPFFREIQTCGEVSMIFFNGVFSHALLKLPKENDFRVQVDHGGSRQKIDLSENIIEQAKEYLKFYDFEILYARVDGIIVDDVLWLMELELIDPVLHFDLHPEALDLFTKALDSLNTR